MAPTAAEISEYTGVSRSQVNVAISHQKAVRPDYFSSVTKRDADVIVDGKDPYTIKVDDFPNWLASKIITVLLNMANNPGVRDEELADFGRRVESGELHMGGFFGYYPDAE